MNKLILSLALLLSAVMLPVYASAQRPSEREREVWMKEMQQYKNDFIAKKLSLTDEQKAKFIPLYNSMDEEIRKAQGEAEQLYRQTVEKDETRTTWNMKRQLKQSMSLKVAKMRLKCVISRISKQF